MSDVRLRPAIPDDIPHLERWDRDPDVIAATTEDDDADTAFGDHDWSNELARHDPGVWEYWIADLESPDGTVRSIGAMLMIDPHLEPTHYWGDIDPNQRALDIWIGEPDCRGKGYGSQMMRLAIARCFEDPAVTAIVIDPLVTNTRAHAFYQRLGFTPTHRQTFNQGEDHCLVHRLTRAEWRALMQGD